MNRKGYLYQVLLIKWELMGPAEKGYSQREQDKVPASEDLQTTGQFSYWDNYDSWRRFSEARWDRYQVSVMCFQPYYPRCFQAPAPGHGFWTLNASSVLPFHPKDLRVAEKSMHQSRAPWINSSLKYSRNNWWGEEIITPLGSPTQKLFSISNS